MFAGVSDEKLIEHKEFGNPEANVVETITVDGGSVSMKITIGGNLFRESKIPIGSEAAEPAADGRPATVNLKFVCQKQQ